MVRTRCRGCDWRDRIQLIGSRRAYRSTAGTLAAGDLFVALRGPNHDGHEFRRCGAGARRRRGDGGSRRSRCVAVRRPCSEWPTPWLAWAPSAPRRAAAAAPGSSRSPAASARPARRRRYGSHWQLPARPMLLKAASTIIGGRHCLSPACRPNAAYGVFELGMNHPGEIAALTRLVRPHVAVVTTVEPAHLGFFPSVEAIADAKAEIFLGLGAERYCNPQSRQPAFRASGYPRQSAPEPPKLSGLDLIPNSDARLLDAALEPSGSTVRATVAGSILRFRLSVPGRHWVINALAVLAAAQAAGAKLGRAAEALAEFEALPGRGRRRELAWHGGALTLIDESYNASPASMRAALAVLAGIEPVDGGRRIAVLGDMLELGSSSERLHRELREPVDAAQVDRVFLVGQAMAALFRSPARDEARRAVAIGRGGCPRPARFSRTRRHRDSEGLPRCARRPYRRRDCARAADRREV